MKKLLLIIGAISIIASCSKHESSQGYGDSSVNLSLQLENCLNTKAIADGKSVDQLMYAVFDDEGKIIIEKAVNENELAINALHSANGYNMSITLPMGHTYTTVFWAQNKSCKAYTVSEDMNVTVDYNGINNDETRDAFFASVTFKVEKGKTVNVMLRRPFAQINVGSYPFDYEHVLNANMKIAKSNATIYKVPNAINLLDGTVSGEADVLYTFNYMPEEDLLVDVDENKENEVYKWLSMSYILADVKDRSTVYQMEFQFADSKETDIIDFKSGLGSVPAARNWRTNIVGQILTGQMDFNIKIDPIFYGDTINSAGLYYNFSQDTHVKDKSFAFNTKEWATFTTENNNLLTLENVEFSGKIGQIAIGEYRGKTVNDVPYTNVLKNVTAKDIKLLSYVKSDGNYQIAITNVEPLDYMSLLFYLRGKVTMEDCEITGTTSVAETYTDYYKDIHDVLTYDCGFPNYSDFTINNCKIGRLYSWSHVNGTITNSKIDYVRCSTHNQTEKKSQLIIGEGCEINEIFISSSGLAKSKIGNDGKRHWVDSDENKWAPSIVIKAGAKVKLLDMNGRGRYNWSVVSGNRVYESNPDVIIEEGAIIEQIINEDKSYVPGA